MKDRQQTIDVLTRGVVKRCRRSRRERLEDALRLPRGWLGGEERPLPGGWTRPLPALRGPSALVRLADARFTGQCATAWQRDVVASDARLADVAMSAAPDSPWARHLARDADLGFALFDLISPYVWRRQFLSGPGGSFPPDLTPHERDVVTKHFVSALEVLLGPWFNGTATLNRAALREWWTQATRARVTPPQPSSRRKP